MINYEHIAAQAAELARLFWLEIETEFTQQIAQRQVGSPECAMTMADTLAIGPDTTGLLLDLQGTYATMADRTLA
jgi:hypothetical protein